MIHKVTAKVEVREDHTAIIPLPKEIPPGMVEVTVTVGARATEEKMSPAELATSEFAGMFADRDDLPRTNEEFIEWRRKLWERKSARYWWTQTF